MFLQNLAISIFLVFGVLLIIAGFKINSHTLTDYASVADSTDAGPWIALLSFLFKRAGFKRYGKAAFVMVGGLLTAVCIVLLIVLN
ncbi:hypothetical protein [Furfurilactobacillus rossiae]|uniref:hypothetical protein n=1 Tax=Furfurilactobacillus rossiae TaxID=231049 RepID=UPI0002E3C4D0|nr:hypothetical protein [Furfurilactobacillus rossiae]QFR67384.1 hypothetical protein LR814_09850 [Furfurilactobacillus rossiae]QLE60324.1 hypothetical protein LROSRS0_0276 [Furfurilactobacillus rossiae]